jgi:hypothetical protein
MPPLVVERPTSCYVRGLGNYRHLSIGSPKPFVPRLLASLYINYHFTFMGAIINAHLADQNGQITS